MEENELHGNSPFGRKATLDGWSDLGSRFERFESQPPTDDTGDHAKLTFRQRQAFRDVQAAINTLDDKPTFRGSGRRTRTSLLTVGQLRYERWWRVRVANILRAAETPAQVFDLHAYSERRAA